jgi:vacuolar-type H+-ATPase subunit I/STV1
MKPSLLLCRRSRRAAAPALPAPAAPEKSEPVIVRPNGMLDSVGQKNELIRVRLAIMIDRLEELRSLKEDFALLSEPVNDLIRSYPQLQSRLLETEAVLKQETETAQSLRRELGDLGSVHTRTVDDLNAAVSQLRKAESKVREQDSFIEDLRLNVKDKEANIADLENQLAIETERARNITEENQALRLEARRPTRPWPAPSGSSSRPASATACSIIMHQLCDRRKHCHWLLYNKNVAMRVATITRQMSDSYYGPLRRAYVVTEGLHTSACSCLIDIARRKTT